MAKVIDKAVEIGEKALDKAGDAAEIGKYKARIAGQKSEIRSAEAKIGHYVYDQYREQDEEQLTVDETLEDYFHTLDACYDEIAILQSKISKIKADEDE
ncbi:MAG: hypothetical protein ACOX41_03940 [Anaerovoracaceae bacterium]